MATGEGSVAFWDEEASEVVELTPGEAAVLLALDDALALEYRRWAGKTGRHGRLVVVDPERIARLQRAVDPGWRQSLGLVGAEG
jgi:hypothetical protein